jgi:NDP-sugar pyrophosphorylase family protein
VARIPEGVAELAKDVLVPSAAAQDGAFALVPHAPADGLWFDLGTPERLAAAEASLLSR